MLFCVVCVLSVLSFWLLVSNCMLVGLLVQIIPQMDPLASTHNSDSGSGSTHTRRTYMLEWSVQPSTLARYKRMVVEFIQWVRDSGEDAADDEFDELLL